MLLPPPPQFEDSPGQGGGAVEVAEGGGCVGAFHTPTWGKTCVALGACWGRMVSPRLAPIGDSGGHALTGSGDMSGRFGRALAQCLAELG